MLKRRFVICFDGTWNTPDKGEETTNVVKMVRAVRSHGTDDVPQIVFYDKGVGTAGGTDALTGGGFGKGLTANVLDGYRFLANNFEPDDEIYIFGFSRGAYTARSLAGLIGLAGLLLPAHLGADLLAVMDVYQKKDLNREEKLAEIDRLARTRPFAPGQQTNIACVGVWDTVGALGIPSDLGRTFLGGKYYFHDVELGKSVDVALHAVAVDEKRSAFSPTLWVSKDGRPVRDGQKVEQVWFAGAHSNVGGSYKESTLSDVALDWMMKRVSQHTRLTLDNPFGSNWSPDLGKAKGIDSRSKLYFVSRFYPYQRIIAHCVPDGGGFGEWFRRSFPKYDRRNVPPDGLRTVNESLHVSLLERWRLPEVLHDCRDGSGNCLRRYRPVNLAAVIEAHHAGRCSVPVVGWDGEELAGPEVWPPSEQASA